MISHKHKCIFIHLPKTAGASIENALTGYGWASVRHEKLKVQHEPAVVLKNIYSEFWNDYFKFSFVRNPWSLLISNFLWSQGPLKLTHDNFKKFILNIETRVKRAKFLDKKSTATWTCHQLPFLLNESQEICLDFIGRFENLKQDFNLVCDNLSIPPPPLPHINKTKHNHYTEYYDDELRDIVLSLYRKDIEYFGYKFGEY